MLVVALLSLACTIFSTPVLVGPGFVVKAEGWGRAAAGTEVELRRGDRVIARVKAGADGLARFGPVTPGRYLVQSAAAEVDIAVDARRAMGARVPLVWPRTTVVRVKEMAGVLAPGPYLLRVVDAANGREIARTETERDGSFSMPGVPPGRYFLMVDTLGQIPVEVDPSASQRILLDVGWTSCGIYYGAPCPATAWRTSRLAGRVTDPENAALAAMIVVRRENRVVAQAEGEAFRFESLAEGEYELSLSAAGFATLRVALTVDRQSDATPVIARLGLRRVCGSLRPEPLRP